uniref:GATA-type domain-containing protein n=1 Tax=Haemonchus contortus TaxID=6289 RepID=A0A6F7PU69_HAECO
MTLVAPPPQQCPSMPSPTSLPNGVAPSPPPPCSGCIKLHADIKQNMQQMMDKFDLIYMRLESLMNEKEKDRLIVQDQEMSESGSDDKDVPSPANSRASPNITQGSRKRKPNKDTVHRVSDDAHMSVVNSSSVCETPAVSAAPSTPVSTTPSGFAESMNFLGSQMMDPLAQQQQLLHFIMQQSLGAAHTVQTSTPQQQTQQQQQQQPPSQPTSITSMTTTTSGGTQVKSEPPEHFNPLMEQLQHQFKEKFDEEDPNASVSRCSNCMTTKTTAWRRDMAGKLVCNACGLYFRLHRTHRPVHMRKDFIQQRFRRKTKEEEVNSPSAMLSSLFGMSQFTGNTNPAAFNFLEQFNHVNSVQEQLNSTAPV